MAATDARLFLRVAINRDALAKAFVENDFDKALAAIRQAIETTVKAKPALDIFIGWFAATAKRNDR